MSLFGKKQEMENNQRIRVFVRCRPLNAIEKRNSSPSVVQCNSEKGEVTVKDKCADKVYNKIFSFDRVFDPHALQIEVYNNVASSLIDEVLMGYNCTVFVYGQTGTGKTYTMEGVNESSSWEKDPGAGIIPRAMHQLFEALNELSVEFSVRVSFLELYNEELFDLLSPSDIVKLKLFEITGRNKGSVLIQGLEEIVVNSKQEVYTILEKGTARRQTAATLLNATSSRSHTVFSVTVFIKDMNIDGEELLRIGKLNLVDLAGSENIGRSGAVDRRAREAGSINQSLLTLGRVITALVEKRPHIPYRGSKLTRILQDSLGGNAKTSIIATISPALCNIEETLSTLDYAYRAKNITNRPEINQRMTKRSLIKEYTEEIERLRRDLTASKEKAGIYMEESQYCSIQNKLLTKNDAIRDLKAEKEIFQDQLEKIQSEYAISRAELNLKHEYSMQQAKQKAELEHKLEEIEQELLLTKQAECSIASKLAELYNITEAHIHTEEDLHHQSLKLLEINNQSSVDVWGLHKKLERMENMNANNEFTHQQYLESYKKDLQKLLEITKGSEKCSISNTIAYIDNLLQEYDKIGIILASFFQEVINSHSKNVETLKEKIDKKAEQIKQIHFLLQALAADKDAANQNCSAYLEEFQLTIKTSFRILSEQWSTVHDLEKALKTQTEELKKRLNHFNLQQKDILKKLNDDVKSLQEQQQRVLINHQSQEKCMIEKTGYFKMIYNQALVSLEEAVESLKTAYINHKKSTGNQWLQSQEAINKMKELNSHNHLFSDKLSEMQESNECFKAECSTNVKDALRMVKKETQKIKDLSEYMLRNQEELKQGFTKYHKDTEKKIEDCAEQHVKIIARNKEAISDCIQDCDKYIQERKAELPELLNTVVVRHEDSSHKFETCIHNRKIEVDEAEYQLYLRVQSLKGKIYEINTTMDNYVFEELLKETQTGQTPENRVYDYSNSFAYTLPYAEILKQCEDKLPEQVNLITKLAEEKAAEDIFHEQSLSETENASFELFELPSIQTPKDLSMLNNSGVKSKLERSGPMIENPPEGITIREKSRILRQRSNMSARSNSISKRRFSRSNTQM